MDLDAPIKLNAEQKDAVRHIEGPLLVVAGAGTGKTSVLVEKIKYIIEKKLARPEEILALTFTEKAAREMEERVDKALPYGYFQMWISTFHSFADQVLRDEITHIGLSPAFKLMTDAESIIFLRQNLFLFNMKYFRPLTNPNKFLDALLQHFSRLKDENISPAEYLIWIQKQKRKLPIEEYERTLELARAYDRYQKLKLKEEYFDFSDLIYYLLQLFNKRRSILKNYQKKFKFVLVDEFQDTNIAQYELIKLLSPPSKTPSTPNLTVVGDDSQAIYKFRGASVSNILTFMSDYPKAKQITLRKNYRSVQSILDAAYTLIKHNDPDTLETQLGISKNLIAIRQDQTDSVRFFLADNVQQEADHVVREVQKLHKEKNYSYGDFALLVRANNHSEPFIRALAQRGIPYQFWGPGMLFRQSEIKDLIAYLSFLSNLGDTMSLYRVLSMNAIDLPTKELFQLLSFAKKTNLSLFEAIEVILSFKDKELFQEEFSVYKAFSPNLSQNAHKTLKKIYKMIQRHLKLVRRESAGQILYYFLEDTGLLESLINYKTEWEERQSLNIMKFFNKLKSYETEHEDASIFAVVDFIKMSMELGESPLVVETDIELYDAVNILTVHSAKGLEFPIVFLINLVDGRFPTRERRETIPIPQELIKEILPQQDAHTLEERRLFYVGVTRTQDKLFLSASKFYGEGKRERKLSPFVLEMLGEHEVNKLLSLKKDEKSQMDLFDEYKKKASISAQASAGKEKILTTFSFTQLQTFQTCQLQYKMKYILHIPEPPTSATSFGSTIHIALEAFYREFRQNKKIGFQRLLQIYRSSWIPVGYSSKSHQERMKKEGEKMLKDYFKKFHNPSVKILDLEKFFKIKIRDFSVEGKIDRLDRLGKDEIEIIDYKTGRMDDEEKLKKSFQLSIYFLAATDKQLYGKKPDEVTLTFYFLQKAQKFSMKKADESIEMINDRIGKIVQEIRSIDWIHAKLKTCNRCPYCFLYSDTKA